MDDVQLISNLIGRQESDDLDFKSKPYNLGNTRQNSKFVKDIIAMANTPRNGPAYILLGVTEHAGKATSVRGIAEHPDEANLLSIVSGRVNPVPKFTYRQVSYEGKELGLIEISNEQPGIIMARDDIGVLRKGAVYVRRNSANIEADSAEIHRIAAITEKNRSSSVASTSGSWEQLYRITDGFDQRRIYICVIDRAQDVGVHDWKAMASVQWNVVVDFDTETDQDGNFSKAETAFRDRWSTQLTALDQPVSFTLRSTVWVATNGLSSRPTTRPTNNWREWIRTKSQPLERILENLSKKTEPTPVTMVVLGGEKDYVDWICNVSDRIFAERMEYVFATPNWESYKDIADRLEASSVTISLPEICQGLRELHADAEDSQEILFPKLDEGTVEIEPSRVHWVEEQLELVHWNVGFLPDEREQGYANAFLKGNIVSWNDLRQNVDAVREITSKLEEQVREGLGLRATRRVNLWHRPGAGATTVARRIAWNLHREFPTVVAFDVQPQETAERLRVLFNETRKPILVVIDLPHVTREGVDRLYDELRHSHLPTVLLHVSRRFDPVPGSDYLDSMLKTWEAARLSQILSDRVPDRRATLESVVNEQDRRRRTPFYFGLVAYGREFRGLESYVETRLSEASKPVSKAILFTAFAYYYGQTSLPLQVFAPIFGVLASKLINMHSTFPEALRELLVESSNRVRPAHHLIAEEILQQELSRDEGDRRNWNVGLADLATDFIDLLSSLPHGERGTLSDILRAVLIDRSTGESLVGASQTQFSQFLTNVPSIDGRRRVLEHLTDAFPEEPHFWAHLGRFYSQESVKDYRKAQEAYQKALQILPDDSLLHHMVGMGWRAELYDLLSTLDSRFSQVDEDKIFYLLKEATLEFDKARSLARRSEYNYISQVQMLEHVVSTVSIIRGYRHRYMEFLTLPGNESYRELVDQAENLLSDLALIKGSEAPSGFHIDVQSRLSGLYGKHSEAIERLTNALDRRGTYKPPLRRAIIRSYVAKHNGNWSHLDDRELARVVELAQENIEQEPTSDYNLRLWLRAVRTENALGVNHVAEQLAYKRLRDPSLDTTYYLYLLRYLQLEAGNLAVRDELPSLIEECSKLAQDLSRTTTSFEWLGNEAGLASLVHVSSLGEWNPVVQFWTNESQLRRTRGRIALINNQGSGQIELHSGLRAFFIPSRGDISGGYIAGQDIGREVEFFLGFSYDGLRAWSVRDFDVD